MTAGVAEICEFRRTNCELSIQTKKWLNLDASIVLTSTKFRMLDDEPKRNFAGDFNCALSENDKKGGNPVWKKSIVIKEVQHLANLYNLTDIWRDRNPNDNRFTWRNKSLKIQCRLDFFLISKELSSDTHACKNAPETDQAVTLHLKTE